MPNITGSFFVNKSDVTSVQGAFKANSPGGGNSANYISGAPSNISLDASRSNSVYGKSNTVQPPSLKIRIVTRFK